MSQKTHKLIRKAARAVDGLLLKGRTKLIKKEYLSANSVRRAEIRKGLKEVIWEKRS